MRLGRSANCVCRRAAKVDRQDRESELAQFLESNWTYGRNSQYDKFNNQVLLTEQGEIKQHENHYTVHEEAAGCGN